jgi:hypothetical protein
MGAIGSDVSNGQNFLGRIEWVISFLGKRVDFNWNLV